jgi:anti-sigma-K factor RskA
MNYVPENERDELPPAAQSLLRDMYAAPSEAGYWERLEARILARVRQEGRAAWWSYVADWRRAGVAAAAAAILLVGLVLFQERQAERRMAEQRLLQPLIDEVPVLVETMADEPRRAREATLRYLISR